MFDLSREVLVQIHVPKSAGTTVIRSIRRAVGVDRSLKLKDSRLEVFRNSRPDEVRDQAEFWVRRRLREARGRHALAPTVPRARLESIDFFCGHVGLGHEPRVSRPPRYFTVLRDPVDRFVVNYFFRKMQAEDGFFKPGSTVFERRGRFSRSPAAFLDLLERRGLQKWRETQCRFFGGSPDWRMARRVIEENDVKVFLFKELPALEQWLRAGLGPDFKLLSAQRVNKARPSLEDVFAEDPSLRPRLERHFAQDLALYRHFAAQRGGGEEGAASAAAPSRRPA